MSEQVKLVVFVPETHAGIVRNAMSEAGAGQLGKYTDCSFSSKGLGRFRPGSGAQPTVGVTGRLETIAEERIEVTCDRTVASTVVSAIKGVHPYEEVAIDVYPLLDISEV